MAELRAFVGHSFLRADADLIRAFLDHFRTLERAGIGFTWEHAEEAEALALSEKVLRKIEDKNVFIGICTRKEYATDGSNITRIRPYFFGKHSNFQCKTSDWIIQEIGLAVGRQMSIVLFLEEGVREPGGLCGDMEYIRFSRERPKDCFDKFLEMLTGLKPKTEDARGVEAEPPETEEEEEDEEEETGASHTVNLEPKPSWSSDDYEKGAMRSILRGDSTALERIDAAYKASDFAEGDACVIWEAKIEHLRILFEKAGDFDKIKRLADENPHIPQVIYFLGSAYEEFQDFARAAEKMEKAAQLTEDEETRVRYLSQAAFQYVRLNEHRHANELLNEVRRRAAANLVCMKILVSTLKMVAEYKKDVTSQLALLEHKIDEMPNDVEARFSLAYLHSQNDNDDMALFHYERIPVVHRDSGTWNNLGVSYGEVGIPVREVRAFRKSAEDRNTLAMSNLGNKLLNIGFFDEANDLCKEAMALPSYDKNVLHLLHRLQAVDDEEEKKLTEALEKVGVKAEFYRELGRCIVDKTPETIADRWTTREGELRAELANDELKLKGNYEKPTGALSSMFIGGLATPASEKYEIEFSGHLRGRMFIGTVVRKREGGPATLLGDLPWKTLMHLSADGMILNVMEDVSSAEPTFYEMRAQPQKGSA